MKYSTTARILSLLLVCLSIVVPWWSPAAATPASPVEALSRPVVTGGFELTSVKTWLDGPSGMTMIQLTFKNVSGRDVVPEPRFGFRVRGDQGSGGGLSQTSCRFGGVFRAGQTGTICMAARLKPGEKATLEPHILFDPDRPAQRVVRWDVSLRI